jgi:hypothetical protein
MVIAPRIIDAPAVRPVESRAYINDRAGIITRAVVIISVGIISGITVVVVSNSDRETESDPH